MRISSASAYQVSIAAIENQQAALAKTQLEVSTGLSINQASDNPAGAATAVGAQVQLSQIAANQTAANASLNVMTQAESSLGSASNLLSQANSDLVAAGNGSLTTSDRQSLSTELSSIRSQLLTLANQSNGTGGYLFSGQGSNGAPFVDTSSGVQFTGVSGQQQTNAGQILPMSMNGQSVWMQVPVGNGVFQTSASASNTGAAYISQGTVSDAAQLTGDTYQIQFNVSGSTTTYSVLQNGVATSTNQAYTSGQAITIDGQSVTISGQPNNGDSFQLAPQTQSTSSVFSILDNAISVLNNSNSTAGQVQQAVNDGMNNISNASNVISGARSEAGDAMNTINALTTSLTSQTTQTTTVQSNAQDVNMAQAISQMQQEQTAYQAALQSYSSVQQLSLFQYISS